MADLQEALNSHDRIRKSTDLPLFFGRKDKDMVPPNLLLDRINRAATVAQWNTDEFSGFGTEKQRKRARLLPQGVRRVQENVRGQAGCDRNRPR